MHPNSHLVKIFVSIRSLLVFPKSHFSQASCNIPSPKFVVSLVSKVTVGEAQKPSRCCKPNDRQPSLHAYARNAQAATSCYKRQAGKFSHTSNLPYFRLSDYNLCFYPSHHTDIPPSHYRNSFHLHVSRISPILANRHSCATDQVGLVVTPSAFARCIRSSSTANLKTTHCNGEIRAYLLAGIHA
jgi:hypothetical protein